MDSFEFSDEEEEEMFPADCSSVSTVLLQPKKGMKKSTNLRVILPPPHSPPMNLAVMVALSASLPALSFIKKNCYDFLYNNCI